MNYKQLSIEERIKLEFLSKEFQRNISYIARKINRSKSTIKRELDRNSIKGQYNALKAHEYYLKRFKSKHRNPVKLYPEFSKLFKQYFDKKWHGVESTWTRIKEENPSINMPSLKQTFNLINKNNWVIKRKDRLRRKYVKGGRRSTGYFSKFNTKYVLPIWTRKESINTRKEFGHWEIDLVIGKKQFGHRSLLTLTERKTRMMIIAPIHSKNPHVLNAVLHKTIRKYNLLVKTITSDNGLEFKALGLFSYQTGIDIYKCNPYASHERGSNENANGLIRREYPKKTDFNNVTDEEIEILMDNINNMPRKIFDFKSAIKMYSSELSKINIKDEWKKLYAYALEKRSKRTARTKGFIYLQKYKTELK